MNSRTSMANSYAMIRKAESLRTGSFIVLYLKTVSSMQVKTEMILITMR